MGISTPLRRSVGIQFRVIGALLMREVLTRYGRRNIGFAWLFVEPMIFTMGVATLWTFTRGAHGSTLPIIPFAITGYSSILLWRNGANRCARAIQPNLSLLYHRNVTVLDIFAARLLLEIAGSTTSLVVLLGIFILIGVAEIPADPVMMVAAWLLLAWFTAGLGLTVGVLAERSEGFERIWHTVTYITFPLSGAIFMVDWLPSKMREWILWVPMVHGVEMLRGGYYGPTVPTHYDLSYFATVNAVLLLLGLLLVDRYKHSVVAE
jgi:capsular polysaccharide transport system permease protein